MTVTIHHEICNYCGACVSVCPSGALELLDTYLRADAEKCKDSCKL
ncbi:MAG TPA: 4Fe-4S binding protein, partial [Methanocorpusculum sp.]|nr:4Fe-4S binding protein [Methanocorpusculum sp.]